MLLGSRRHCSIGEIRAVQAAWSTLDRAGIPSRVPFGRDRKKIYDALKEESELARNKKVAAISAEMDKHQWPTWDDATVGAK
jgi:hypothetical protein